MTSYDYGPGGGRIKKTNGTDQTVYLGTSEIRNFGQVTSEVIVHYPHDDVRSIDGVKSWLHRDQLSSVRLITDDAGSEARLTSYTPFGEPIDAAYDLASMPEESNGFIGEYYDDEAVGAVSDVRKGAPNIHPQDVSHQTPSQIDELAKDNGLIPKGPDPQDGRGRGM